MWPVMLVHEWDGEIAMVDTRLLWSAVVVVDVRRKVGEERKKEKRENVDEVLLVVVAVVVVRFQAYAHAGAVSGVGVLLLVWLPTNSTAVGQHRVRQTKSRGQGDAGGRERRRPELRVRRVWCVSLRTPHGGPPSSSPRTASSFARYCFCGAGFVWRAHLSAVWQNDSSTTTTAALGG